jgi:hypothetical protein
MMEVEIVKLVATYEALVELAKSKGFRGVRVLELARLKREIADLVRDYTTAVAAIGAKYGEMTPDGQHYVVPPGEQAQAATREKLELDAQTVSLRFTPISSQELSAVLEASSDLSADQIAELDWLIPDLEMGG